MSQLNFFLTSDEILAILSSLIKTEEIEIFKGRFFEKEIPDPIKNIDEIIEFDELIFWLTNGIKQPKCYESKFKKGVFLFDFYKDPIIEFSDCKRTSGLISPGRIFYKAGWIDDAELRKNHTNWTKRVSKLFDKKLTLKKIDNFWRISNQVETWVINGGTLELGPGGKRINKENLKIRMSDK